MSLRKLFHKSNNENMASSLKHSKSMPQGLSSRETHVDTLKPVYRGKTPLKTTDIIYVEQAPGMLDIHHAQMYQDISANPSIIPPRPHPDTFCDLLDKFPSPPGPPPRPPRNPLRKTSLNTNNVKPQIVSPSRNANTSGRERTMYCSPSVACFSRPTATAYPSLSTKQQKREATADEAMKNVLQSRHDKLPILGSSTQAQRVRAQSHTAAYNTAPPLPTSQQQRSVISGSPHRSRVNLRHVPSHATMPYAAALTHAHSFWPPANYRELLKEQDPHTIHAMIKRYPVAPLSNERLPEHLQPILFDMNDERQFQKTLSYFIHIAVAQGRPLDARADGVYHRIIDAGEPLGIVPEVGSDWSQRAK